jgi:hypothetical protein
MSMPAFTAEASLYKSRTQYNMSVSRFLAAKADIQPQLRLRPPKDCIPGCVCVSPINCPCCKSWPWPQPMDEAIFFRRGKTMTFQDSLRRIHLSSKPARRMGGRWEAHGLRPMRFVPQRILSSYDL